LVRSKEGNYLARTKLPKGEWGEHSHRHYDSNCKCRRLDQGSYTADSLDVRHLLPPSKSGFLPDRTLSAESFDNDRTDRIAITEQRDRQLTLSS
jgi:hypothetical protein